MQVHKFEIYTTGIYIRVDDIYYILIIIIIRDLAIKIGKKRRKWKYRGVCIKSEEYTDDQVKICFKKVNVCMLLNSPVFWKLGKEKGCNFVWIDFSWFSLFSALYWHYIFVLHFIDNLNIDIINKNICHLYMYTKLIKVFFFLFPRPLL